MFLALECRGHFDAAALFEPQRLTMPQRHEHLVLRVATDNIHKGVQGLGPTRRLEIHNLGHAVGQLDADIVCLPEVRRMHRREERYFISAHAPVLVASDFNDWGTGLGRRMAQAGFGEWPEQPTPTFPSRLPLNQLDHIYARDLTPVHARVPSCRIWQRMSDHLPLVAEFAWTD
jgi:endonuclease/exonuclease/phosphatase family metal-dependent hydrolase